MTPEQLAEAQRLAREWKPKGEWWRVLIQKVLAVSYDGGKKVKEWYGKLKGQRPMPIDAVINQ